MKLEELERDYRSERRQLEAQEDELIHFKNQGLRLMEQEEQRLHHVLKNLALDNEPLFQARRSYSNYQEHYQQALQVRTTKTLSAARRTRTFLSSKNQTNNYGEIIL
ncbi:hypothetical protein Q3F52_07105 [Enterococcus faecium]|nr:hypothetical protein [Enterococcus faecium]